MKTLNAINTLGSGIFFLYAKKIIWVVVFLGLFLMWKIKAEESSTLKGMRNKE